LGVLLQHETNTGTPLLVVKLNLIPLAFLRTDEHQTSRWNCRERRQWRIWTYVYWCGLREFHTRKRLLRRYAKEKSYEGEGDSCDRSESHTATKIAGDARSSASRNCLHREL